MKKIVPAFGLMALSLTSVYARDDQSESENEEVMELHQAIEVRKEAFKEAQKNEVVAPINADQEKYTEDKTIETEVPQAKKEVETSNLLQKMVKALFSFFQ